MSNSKLLLTQPEEYAKQAIISIEHQLLTAKGSNRISKLKHRLNKWTKTLEVLAEESKKDSEK